MKVLLFADLAQAAGSSEVHLEIAREENGQDLWRKLVAIYPQLNPFRSHVRLAKDFEIIGWEEPLGRAAEVAFLPPFSGG